MFTRVQAGTSRAIVSAVPAPSFSFHSPASAASAGTSPSTGQAVLKNLSPISSSDIRV